MKKFIFIILIIIIVLIGFFIYKSNKTEHPNYSSNYTAEKTSTSTNNINTTNSMFLILFDFIRPNILQFLILDTLNLLYIND